MDGKEAVLMGPFVGELYWEFGRFAPMLPYLKKYVYQKKDVIYIVMTREERFDIYGRYANIFIPLRIPGDYDTKMPNCFRLNNFPIEEYEKLKNEFYSIYRKKYKILEHIAPKVDKANYVNKFQYDRNKMIFTYKPRLKNYEVVENFLPKDNKKIIILAPRYRKGFRRNWNSWPKFYDILYNNKELYEKYNFVICGKNGEYIPDDKNRFLDMNQIKLEQDCSLIGLLMVLMSKAYFTFGSQSSIPNISLLYNVDVLEFGCQKNLHTRTYNIKNTPITFIENKNYDIEPEIILENLIELLKKKEKKHELVSTQSKKN